MIGWMFDQATKWLAGFVADMLNTVWKLLTATLFHLPDVAGLPQVQDLTAKSLTVVNIGYVLLIMTAGVVAMTHGSVQARYSAGELLPRLCIGLVAANFGTWICRQIIGAGNALVLALTGEGIATDKTLQMLLHTILEEVSSSTAMLLSVIIGLTIDILVLLLLVGWIVRFAILIIVCGTAPIALACHGLPWTDPVAQLWWKTLGGVVVTVVLQAIALHTSLSIWLNPASNLPAIGWPFDPSGVLNLLVVAVLLWVTVRIPGLVKQYVTGSRGRPNLLGMIVRLVIVQQLTRGLGGLVRGGSSAGVARTGGIGRSGGSGGTGGSARLGPLRPPSGGSTSRGGRQTAGTPNASPAGTLGTTSSSRGSPTTAAHGGTAPNLPSPQGQGSSLPRASLPRAALARAAAGQTARAGQVAQPASDSSRPSVRARVPVTDAGPGTGWPDVARAYRPLTPGNAAARSGTGWPRPAPVAASRPGASAPRPPRPATPSDRRPPGGAR